MERRGSRRRPQTAWSLALTGDAGDELDQVQHQLVLSVPTDSGVQQALKAQVSGCGRGSGASRYGGIALYDVG